MGSSKRGDRLNLAQVINPVTGHIDAARVRFLQMTELACGWTLEELLIVRRVSVRVHEHRGPPGQGRREVQ